MNYLIQEITLYMFGAFLIGALYGWLMCGMRSKHDLDVQLQRHQQELERWRSHNQRLTERVEQLELIPASGAGQDWQDEYDLKVIADIEASTLPKLAQFNIETTKQLCKHCHNQDALYDLAEKIGVEDFAIQRWLFISQLLRVANIEVDDAVLLEAIEIYSLSDLSEQKPRRLREKLTKHSQRENIPAEIPGEGKLAAWIEHAQHILTLGKP